MLIYITKNSFEEILVISKRKRLVYKLRDWVILLKFSKMLKINYQIIKNIKILKIVSFDSIFGIRLIHNVISKSKE